VKQNDERLGVIAPKLNGIIHQILDDFHPDILHIQDHFPVCRAMVLAVRPGSLKLVGTNHFMPDNVAPFAPFLSWNKPWFDQASWSWMREVYDRLDAVAAPSRTAAEMLRKIGLRPPVSAISCGVDLHIFQPDPSVDRSAWRLRYGAGPNQKVFFFIGRVDPDKCLEVIIRAVALLDREDIQVMIAGEGAAKASLMAQVQHLGLERKVRFTGSIPNADLPSLLNSIDIFFMPGEAELLSIASLQAMGCARPMLVADAVALPELVTSGENGLLFHPKVLFAASRAARHLVLLNLQTLQQSLVTEDTRKYQLSCVRALDHNFSHSDPPLAGLGPETDRQPQPSVLTCALFYHAPANPSQLTQMAPDRAVGPRESHVRDTKAPRP